MTETRPVRVVAFGGGHGLGACLRSLRSLRSTLPLEITAVVTVGDDGGSSGRLRDDRGVLPPGDLRQALVALARQGGPPDRRTAELFQYRFSGGDHLAGHAVGNLVLCGLMEQLGDPVAALDHAADMLGCTGRVLPMSRTPVQLEAEVVGLDRNDPQRRKTVRGQHAVAVTPGVVQTVRLTPSAPPACAEAVAAVDRADWLIFGPGSWYTSVIPHLLVPDLAAAVAASPARRLVTLNLSAEKETAGLSLPDHLAALRRYLPALRVDVVIADSGTVGDPTPVRRAAESLGARLVLDTVAAPDGTARSAPDGSRSARSVPGVSYGTARHDPAALAEALEPLLRAG